MTLRADALEKSCDAILDAALAGEPIEQPLETMARAGGAEGLTLVRQNPADSESNRNRSEFVLATSSVRDPVLQYLTGRAPPDPRHYRVNPTRKQGFVADFDHFRPEEIGRDPFYQDFLRGWGFQWHACAQIKNLSGDGLLYLSLKRRLRDGHYDRADITALNRSIPRLQVALSVSQSILRARQDGARRAGGDHVALWLELDARGRVSGPRDIARMLPASGISLVRGRLKSPLAHDQSRLDRTIAATCGPARKPSLVVLGTGDPHCRAILKCYPIVDSGDEVFVGTVAVAALTIWRLPESPPNALVDALATTYGLTPAEARVTSMIGLGMDVSSAATSIGVGVGTARNRLKSAQAKIGLSRQAELAAFMGHLWI